MIDMSEADPKSQQEENIDYWLMSISRVHSHKKLLPSYIFSGVREYMDKSFKLNPMIVQETSEF